MGPGLVRMLISAVCVQAMYKHKAVSNQISIYKGASVVIGGSYSILCCPTGEYTCSKNGNSSAISAWISSVPLFLPENHRDIIPRKITA